MSTNVQMITFFRQQFVNTLEGLTVEQMNTIPTGFNNNIIWNLAHIIAVQQEYGYRRVGVPPVVDDELITAYLGGTMPQSHVDQAGIDIFKALALSTITDLSHDIASGAFDNLETLTITQDKINLDTLDDVLSFILFHDGLHLATVRAMIRVLATSTPAQTQEAA